MQTQIISITPAQYRMLKRAIRGETLSASQYPTTNKTVGTLNRKKCWEVKNGKWCATGLGHKVLKDNGKHLMVVR